MPLYIVPTDKDERRARYEEATGKIRRIGRGVYIDMEDDPVAVCQQNVLRLMRHLRPKAYLSHLSALNRGPVREPDGSLTIYGSMNYFDTLTLPGVTFKFRRAPAKPDLVPVTLMENGKPIVVQVSSDLQNLAEMCHQFPKGEPTDPLIDKVQARGALDKLLFRMTPKEVLQKAEIFTARNSWRLALERICEIIDEYISSETSDMVSTISEETKSSVPGGDKFHVAWHATPIGDLSYDGINWFWNPVETEGWYLPFRKAAGQLPTFLQNSLPEGEVQVHLSRDEHGAVAALKRLMSNITIGRNMEELAVLPKDVLLSPLDAHCQDGTFQGYFYEDMRLLAGDITSGKGAVKVAQLMTSRRLPGISGMQVKVPVCLSVDGGIGGATDDRVFTHILKLPPMMRPGMEVAEWLGAQLADGAGLEIAPVALARLDSGIVGLLVERFDIRRGRSDATMIFSEDFCSILGQRSEQKAHGSWEAVAAKLDERQIASPDSMTDIVRRAVLSHIVGDGDAHLKNLGMVSYADRVPFRNGEHFHTSKLAPVYDVVPGDAVGGYTGMILTINGKNDGVKKSDLVAFGHKVLGTRRHADEVVTSTAQAIVDRMAEILKDPPAIVAADDRYMRVLRDVWKTIAERAPECGAVLPDLAAEMEPPAVAMA